MEQVIIVHSFLKKWIKKYTNNCEIPLSEKKLLEDKETGMEVSIAHYPAGYKTVLHRHSIGHGMYVLDGKLWTNKGILEKYDFIWFPAGTEMEHGAAEDDDCTVLFITNGKFDIEYIEDSNESQS